MSRFLLCAVPLDGHVAPMLAVCRVLVNAGHTVRFLTGAAYGQAVTAAGAEHVPLPPSAEVTAAMLDAGRARGGKRLSGLSFAIENTRRNFVQTLPGWFAALGAEIERGCDAVFAEVTVFAVGALCHRTDRPPIVACGAFPVVLLSRDTPPPMLGLGPRSDAIGQLRHRILNLVVGRLVFGGLQREADAAASEWTGSPARALLIDWPRDADVYAQFTVPAFEYARSDAPAGLVFLGPLPTATVGATSPPWWNEVDSAGFVVHVSQGTVANRDFEELIWPTVRALADTEALVVVATGGRPVSDLGDLPANVRAASLLDYGRLMPHVDVFVTNGGYGSIHAALAHGVPMVAAGDTEDKVETCARVAWAGVGLNLRTGTPTSRQLRAAIEEVRSNPSYRAAAARLQADIRGAPGEAGLLEVARRVTMPVPNLSSRPPHRPKRRSRCP